LGIEGNVSKGKSEAVRGFLPALPHIEAVGILSPPAGVELQLPVSGRSGGACLLKQGVAEVFFLICGGQNDLIVGICLVFETRARASLSMAFSSRAQIRA
jgi:hypothetical protein